MDRLPSELWDLILSQISNSLLEQTTRNLLTITNKISIVYQYKHLTINNDQELNQLRRATSPPNQDLTQLIQSISLYTWRLRDNNLFINLINAAPKIRFINLHIGPLFAPDQLEELFLNHKSSLEILVLRFNQNVSIRSYEPFLKGAYFDTCLDLLAKWPESPRFQSLSFVQDPPPKQEEKAHLNNEGIAQPIILFRFWSITNLAVSPLGRHLRHLRLRIPARNVATALTNNSTRFESLSIGRHQFTLPVPPFPNLSFLDLSTSTLSSVLTGLGPLLRRFPNLNHLILDRSHLIIPARFPADLERVDETLRAIGSSIATAGISRALESKKLWNDLYSLFLRELEHEHLHSCSKPTPPPTKDVPVSKPSGSSTATTKTKRGRSAYGSAPRWKSSTTTPSSTPSVAILPISSSSHQTRLIDQRMPEKVTLLPDYSRLISLCCGTDLPPSSSLEVDEDHQEIREHWNSTFQSGFQLGTHKVDLSLLESLDQHQRSLKVWKTSLNKLLQQHLSFRNNKQKKKRLDGGGQVKDPDQQEEEEEEEEEEARGEREREREEKKKKEEEECEKEIARKIRNRPVILLLSSLPYTTTTDPTVPEEAIFERFKRAQNLHEPPSSTSSPEEDAGLEGFLLSYKTQRRRTEAPWFCTLNDCPKEGLVGWSSCVEQSCRPIPLLHFPPPPPPLPPQHLPPKLPINPALDGDDDPLALIDKINHLHLAPTPPSLHTTPKIHTCHTLKCAHDVARHLWDIDSW